MAECLQPSDHNFNIKLNLIKLIPTIERSINDLLNTDFKIFIASTSKKTALNIYSEISS